MLLLLLPRLEGCEQVRVGRWRWVHVVGSGRRVRRVYQRLPTADNAAPGVPLSRLMPRRPKPPQEKPDLSGGSRITIRVTTETVEQIERVLARSRYGTTTQIVRHALELGLAELLRRDDR